MHHMQKGPQLDEKITQTLLRLNSPIEIACEEICDVRFSDHSFPANGEALLQTVLSPFCLVIGNT
ncbi:hypothetical protein N430_05156 [Pseudomonas sp. CC120222-01a]|nr:hypothetical protein N430_05156 [Pseudomonas sp. CC120222-01a]